MQMQGRSFQTVIAALLLAVTWVGKADARRRSPETDLAAPGARLYEYAVAESVKGLMSKQEKEDLGTKGRPPSPGPDYYWCNNCKIYHKRPAPTAPKQPAAAQQPGTAPASPPQAATAVKPPSPGPDYFWCENCKTYHKRQTPAAAQQPGALPADPQAPGGDYYYCENCKTYHRRQPLAQQPAAGLSPFVGGATNSPNLNPLTTP